MRTGTLAVVLVALVALVRCDDNGSPDSDPTDGGLFSQDAEYGDATVRIGLARVA